MKVGDLVTNKRFKGSIGFVLNRATWTCESVYEIIWFKHYHYTGMKAPVYDWEVEVINEDR